MDNSRFEDRRVFMRFTADLLLKVYNPSVNKVSPAKICNLSANGLNIIIKEKLKPNAKLEFWLKNEDEQEPLYVKGVVIWTKKLSLRKYSCGICLEKVELVRLSRVLSACNGQSKESAVHP